MNDTEWITVIRALEKANAEIEEAWAVAREAIEAYRQCEDPDEFEDWVIAATAKYPQLKGDHHG